MGSFFRELFQVKLYKRSQGRVARQVTFAALAILFGIGGWRLSQHWMGDAFYQYGVAGVFLMLGWWCSYRLVNVPEFADFLISVEAEMSKVSWPSRTELFRSALVVIFMIFFLAATLFCYDLIWDALLVALKVKS